MWFAIGVFAVFAVIAVLAFLGRNHFNYLNCHKNRHDFGPARRSLGKDEDGFRDRPDLPLEVRICRHCQCKHVSILNTGNSPPSG